MKLARNDIKKKDLLQVKSHAEILSLLSLRGTAVFCIKWTLRSKE